MLSNIAGWLGMILLLTAYFLISTQRVTNRSKLYHFLNMLGAAGIIWNTFVQKAWPAMSLNVVWVMIALSAILLGKKTKVK